MSRCKNSTKLSTPDADLARWCAALAAPSSTPEQVPAGWFTVVQLAEKIGRSTCNTQQRIRVMLKNGRAEQKNFRVLAGKMVRPVPHYRLK